MWELKRWCNTFTPQIKGIPADTFAIIPHHRYTSKCTLVYIQMYPGKVVALQKSKPLSSKQELPWCGWGLSVCFIQESIVRINQCSQWWVQVSPEEALKWRNFGVLAVLTVRKCYWKVRTSLTAHSQAFQHVFECRHTHIMGDTSYTLYNKAYPL